MNIYGEVPEYRNILVAVISGHAITNEYFQPICSSNAGIAVKMTNKVLNWIRKNMQRVDTKKKRVPLKVQFRLMIKISFTFSPNAYDND